METKEYLRTYYANNKDRLKILKASWYQKNKARLLMKDREYKQKNKAHINSVRKNYASYGKWKSSGKYYGYKRRSEMTPEQKDRANAQSRAYYRRAKERLIPYYFRRRMLKNKLGGNFTALQWKLVKERQNNLCLHCKELKELTIDHIIPISKWVKWALENNPSYKCNDIENIQALCKKCNCIKNNRI